MVGAGTGLIPQRLTSPAEKQGPPAEDGEQAVVTSQTTTAGLALDDSCRGDDFPTAKSHQ